MRRAALLQVIREDTPARVWRVPDGGITAEPAWRAISTLAPVLKAIYGHLGCSRAAPVTFGCDCTGSDAPGQAWLSVGRCLEHLGIMKLELRHLFSSEDPKATHAHNYLIQNSATEVLYADMTLRGDGHGPAIWTRGSQSSAPLAAVPLPAAVMNYHSSFTCQD